MSGYPPPKRICSLSLSSACWDKHRVRQTQKVLRCVLCNLFVIYVEDSFNLRAMQNIEQTNHVLRSKKTLWPGEFKLFCGS